MNTNQYATKKTLSVALLDAALLSASASQLRYILQVTQHTLYYILYTIYTIYTICYILYAISYVLYTNVYTIYIIYYKLPTDIICRWERSMSSIACCWC